MPPSPPTPRPAHHPGAGGRPGGVRAAEAAGHLRGDRPAAVPPRRAAAGGNPGRWRPLRPRPADDAPAAGPTRPAPSGRPCFPSGAGPIWLPSGGLQGVPDITPPLKIPVLHMGGVGRHFFWGGILMQRVSDVSVLDFSFAAPPLFKVCPTPPPQGGNRLDFSEGLTGFFWLQTGGVIG